MTAPQAGQPSGERLSAVPGPLVVPPQRLQGLLRWVAERDQPQRARGYALAVATVAAAAGLRAALDLAVGGLAPTLFIFLGAVAAAAIFAGAGPALVAATLSVLIANYFFIGERTGFDLAAGDLVAGAAFLIEGGLFALFGGRLRSLLRRQLNREAAIAGLYQAAVRSEHELRRANYSLQLLADAGLALNASLDPSETLPALARRLVPEFAGACLVDLRDGRTTRRVAEAFETPEVSDVVAGLLAVDLSGGLPHAMSAAANDGVAWFVGAAEPATLRRLFGLLPGGEGGPCQPRSAIVVPVESGRQVFGAMAFLRFAPSAPFHGADLVIARQLGTRVGLAIENARLYADARRANDAKDEFLGVMSHELRTPVTVIQGGVRYLRDHHGSRLDPAADAVLADLERESLRLARMLQDLLALSRAELDALATSEPVLLQRLIPRLCAGLDPGNSCRLEVRGDETLPPVSADPVAVEHILRNLVHNAARYGPPGGPIEVSLHEVPDGVAVTVADRGPGVAPDELNRIFERFYRSPATAQNTTGAGLGLAVCRRLVEAMGGTITAGLREGGGLAVTFVLPRFPEPEVHDDL
ncbi:sensor histidine kinase [Tepidiforma sp.]|uniref:sensor histidine kinase n=1 Tax=Tepidiforma sp. TaxID=2682230 RepID=UPI002ADE05B4|nr:ATP-binding protein [Tepidiforma sp.]